MKLKKNCSSLILSLSFGAAFAAPIEPAPAPAVGGFEVIGGGGWVNARISDASIRVTSDEIDTLARNRGKWDSGIGQLGIGYVGPLVQGSGFFNTLRVQLNSYFTSDSLSGPVYRFGDPAFNDYNYELSVKSTRLMLDGLVDLFSANSFSLYAKGGIGPSWNRANYSEVDLNGGGCASNPIYLNRDSHAKFAAEAGAGVRFDISQNMGISLEYLYAHLGKAQTGSGSAASCVSSVTPVNFDLKAQSVIIALHYTFA